MLCIETWDRVLILILIDFVLIISIYLIRAYFWNFFFKFTVSKVLSNIILEYIVACEKILKKSILGKKSLLKSVLSLVFHK